MLSDVFRLCTDSLIFPRSSILAMAPSNLCVKMRISISFICKILSLFLGQFGEGLVGKFEETEGDTRVAVPIVSWIDLGSSSARSSILSLCAQLPRLLCSIRRHPVPFCALPPEQCRNFVFISKRNGMKGTFRFAFSNVWFHNSSIHIKEIASAAFLWSWPQTTLNDHRIILSIQTEVIRKERHPVFEFK